MSAAEERLAKRVKAVADNAAEVLRIVDGVLSRKREAKRVHRDLGKPTKASKEAEEKAASDARLAILAEIRVELHREAGGNCVVCGLSLPFVRMHAHHILSGPERRAEERKETMAPLHEKCHDWIHGRIAGWDQRDALSSLQAWCEQTGREDAARSTRNRIAKIDEARAAAEAR